MRTFILIMLGTCLICGCAGPFQTRQTQWSVPEVKNWYADYRQNNRDAWNGILYQGSDAHWHHFVARVPSVDNWAIIQINKGDLVLADERPYSAVSSKPFGYYYVDPNRNFMKIRDY